MDKASLVEQCKNGDREALGLLYSRYSGRMMKIIRHYIHDPEVASDILHDGFIVAFTQIAKLRDCNKLEYWLGTIMKNLSIQYLNQLELTTLLNDDIDVPDIPEIHTLISYDELEAIINLLPDGYRKVFKLAVLENMSHAEIGKLLGIAPHSSSSQLFRAKELLRKIMREHGIETSSAIGIILLLATMLPRLLTSDITINPADTVSSDTSVIYISQAPPAGAEYPKQAYANALESNTGNPQSSPIQQDIAKAETNGATETSVAPETIDTNDTEDTDITQEPTATDYIAPETDTMHGEEKPRHVIAGNTSHIAGLNLSVNASLNSRNPNTSSGYINNSANPGFSNPSNPTLDASSDKNEDNGYTNIKHQPTISVSLTANHMFTHSIGIESGVTYSYLRSEASRFNNQYRFRYHYIGIPLKLNLNIYSTPGLRIYGSAGAGIDIPVSATREDDFGNDPISAPIQWSLNGGIGLQLNITRQIGLYAEPSLRYNFRNNDSEVINKWADERFQFTIPIGLRLNF